MSIKDQVQPKRNSLKIVGSAFGLSLIAVIATAEPSGIATDVASTLVEQQDSFQLNSYVEQKAKAYSLGAINTFLSTQSRRAIGERWKYLEFSFGEEGGSVTFEGKSVYGLKETKNYFVFNQSSIGHFDSRTTLNFGLGARHINDAETIIFGLNAFYDYELGSAHKRASIGGEFLTSLGQIRVNQYKALSGDIIYDGGTETALDGTDVKLTYELPFFYGADIHYKYTHWYDGDYNDHRREVGFSAEIIPYVNLALASYDSSQEGSDTTVSISYSLPLGGAARPQKSKLDGNFTTDLKPIRDMLYIPVERENRIMKKTVKMGVTFSGY